jgi:nicotinamidase-related amidase
MINLPEKTALVIVDVQQGFDEPYWGTRNNPDAEQNIGRLLKFWRERKRPIVHVRHNSVEPESPLRPGQSGNDFKSVAQPLAGERIEGKNVNSAFIGTKLEEHLRGEGIGTLVIAGISTDHCVSTTTRMAGNLGFETYVVSDATHTFDRTGYDGTRFSADEIHASALASLHNEFATVVTTSELLG